MNEIDWKQGKLLKNGAKALTNSSLLGVLYIRWKKLKRMRESLTPNCESSFLA